MSRRVSFSPEQPPLHSKHGPNLDGNKKRVILKTWSFRVIPRASRFSPGKLLGHIGAKFAGVLELVSDRRRCSRKVCLTRSRSYADQNLDSQRAEAIEDCIQFLNSSSSLLRSNSDNSQ